MDQHQYVDDVYAIMKKTEVEPFRAYLNTISIKFTKELEKSGQLAFLDVSIQQMEGGLIPCNMRIQETNTRGQVSSIFVSSPG